MSSKQCDALLEQSIAYESKKEESNKEWQDAFFFESLKEFVTHKRILIKKYNYSMDKKVQNFDFQNAIIQV